MGGHAAARRIRMEERYENLPIVAMTAHATDEEREACMKSGMQDHIAKPISPDHFYATLTRWLAHAQAPATENAPLKKEHPASLPIQIPGFDTATTMDRLDGDVALYHRVLEMLMPSLSTSIAHFSTALASSDRAGAKRIVHSIRGMAANVGALALTASAAELEQRMNENRERPEQLAAFGVLIEQTLKLVEQALAERKMGPVLRK
jgi:two-component system, sensor histidine kinase and response regulator